MALSAALTDMVGRRIRGAGRYAPMRGRSGLAAGVDRRGFRELLHAELVPGGPGGRRVGAGAV